MDPASLSFGVVSLAMQIVETAVVIRRYISAYKSASKEIQGLSDKLDDIETICQSLEFIIDGYEKTPQPRGVTMLGNLKKTMEKCRNRISTLHGLISQIVPSTQTTRNPLKSTGALFLRHRSELRKCDDDLSDSLRVLHLHVSTTTCVLVVQSSSTEPGSKKQLTKTPSTPVQSIEVLSNSLVPQGQNKDPYRAVSVYRQERSYGWASFCRYCRSEWKTTRTESSMASFVEEEYSFFVGSHLLGLYAKLLVRRGPFSPWSVAIEIPHLVYRDEDDVVKIIVSDDLLLFQRALADGLIRPQTLLKDSYFESHSELGTLLFEFAMGKNAFDICNFLVQHDQRLKERIIDRRSFLSNIYDQAQTKIVVDVLGPWIPMSYFKRFLEVRKHPSEIIWLIDTCEPFFLDELNEFYTIIWDKLLYCFIRNHEGCQDTSRLEDRAWCMVARRISHSIYSSGTYRLKERRLYVFDGNPARTFLGEILFWAQTTAESQFLVQRWLEFLKLSGVDLHRYLEVEKKVWGRIVQLQSLWENNLDFPPDSSRRLRRVIREADWGGLKVPYWELEVQESCAIRELLMEFPCVAPYTCYYWQLAYSAYLYRLAFKFSWNRVLFCSKRKELGEWPFRDPELREISGLNTREHKQWLRLRLMRFDRKQLKKSRKRRKLDGEFFPKREMPGTWQDEFDI